MHAPEEQAVDSIRTSDVGSEATDHPLEVLTRAEARGFTLGAPGLVAVWPVAMHSRPPLTFGQVRPSSIDEVEGYRRETSAPSSYWNTTSVISSVLTEIVYAELVGWVSDDCSL